MLRCGKCNKLIHVQNLADCPFVALGLPACSYTCYEAIYALGQFELEELPSTQLRLDLE